jgi:hypothetical protein
MLYAIGTVMWLAFLAMPASGQDTSPGDRFAQARAMYYIPTAKGLASFHCDISIDWKDLMARFGGRKLADDDPYLHYLNSVRLSVNDDLTGKTVVGWANIGSPPAASETAAKQMHTAIEQIVRSFFEPWNSYMNGAMVPPLDNTVTVTKAGKGFLIHEVTASGTMDEKYDANLVLTEAHVVTKDNDAMAYPKFMETPDGRIISVIRTTYQTPAAPRTDITMTVTYLPVGSFKIPATLKANFQKAGDIRLGFSSCMVKTTPVNPPKTDAREPPNN